MATTFPNIHPVREVGSPEEVDALWVVALVSELTPLLALLHQPRLRSHRLCVGQIQHLRVALLRCGVGPTAAEARTRAALARLRPRSVWSVGSCGALKDQLSVGTCLTAHRLVAPCGGSIPVCPVQDLPSYTLHTVTRPVFTPEARRASRQTGATACEMEAAGVARAVGDRCPLFVVKVVSDLAGGAPDPAIDAVRAVAMARFHLRVEGLMRREVAPQLPRWVRAQLANLPSPLEPVG